MEIVKNPKLNSVIAAFLGHSIGDALGVPFEFAKREILDENPITEYVGEQQWSQPPGVFSDDTSMMLCTAEGLSGKYNLSNISSLYVRWYIDGYWTARGEVFGEGATVKDSIKKIIDGTDPKNSGGSFPDNNGNGSLMRILPLVFFLQNKKDPMLRYKIVSEVSGITHNHIRSKIACFIFVEYGIQLLENKDKIKSLEKAIDIVVSVCEQLEIIPYELAYFDKIFSLSILSLDRDSIVSSGYVIDSLESSLWCFLKSKNYSEAVFSAVNLGVDADTVGAITGGLSGLYYGLEDIPKDLIDGLSRSEDIQDLASSYYSKILL